MAGSSQLLLFITLSAGLIILGLGYWGWQRGRRRNGTAGIAYDQIVESLPEAVMVIDAQQRILSANPVMQRLLHQEAGQLIGQHAGDIVPELSEYLAQPDKPYAGEDILVMGRYVELIAEVLPAANGRATGQVIVLRDTTVRRHTEQALFAYERRYLTLFENSKDAIFILGLDADSSIVIASPQAAALLKTDLGTLLQSNAISFIPRSRRTYFHDYIERLTAGEAIPLYETTFLRSDGSEIPVEVSLTLVRDADEQPHNIQLIARDITDRKEAEQIMQSRLLQLAILREVDEEVSRSLDIESVVQVTLDAAVRLSRADAGFVALTEEDDVIIQRVTGLYDPTLAGQRLEYDLGVTGRVLETHESERVLNVADDPGYYQNIEETEALIAIPLVSQDRLVGIVSLETIDAERFSENIYQLLQLMMSRVAVALENARLYDRVRHQVDELQNLNEELLKAEVLKTDMIRIANHDLKNPLGIVRGYVDLLQLDQDRLPPEFTEYFKTMQKSLERMANILDDFLSVEAITERASGATMTQFDMRPLVARAIDEYQPQSNSKQITLTASLPDPDLALVIGDESQLYEAITNLISNAIKYTPTSGTIQVDLRLSSDDYVHYEVQDSGYGIPENRQQHLFEPFYRTKTDETATIEGTGLGLHLVKNIIERHDGDIIFKSIYQEGSTFGFKLPLAASLTHTDT